MRLTLSKTEVAIVTAILQSAKCYCVLPAGRRYEKAASKLVDIGIVSQAIVRNGAGNETTLLSLPNRFFPKSPTKGDFLCGCGIITRVYDNSSTLDVRRIPHNTTVITDLSCEGGIVVTEWLPMKVFPLYYSL